MPVVMSTIREISDAINQGVGLTTEPVFHTFADRLIVEGS